MIFSNMAFLFFPSGGFRFQAQRRDSQLSIFNSGAIEPAIMHKGKLTDIYLPHKDGQVNQHLKTAKILFNA